MEFTKLTVLYGDILSPINWRHRKFVDEFQTFYLEEDYLNQKQSKRVEWVKTLCAEVSRRQFKSAIMTNDYAFISLLQHFCPRKDFSIYDVDNEKLVDSFGELDPNPTLEVFEFLYESHIKTALKGG